MMRLFLISLGVTCLASVILFLYFRNRVGRMEQKVDLMFQLIQEYDKSKNIEPSRTFQQVPSANNTMQMGGNVTHDDLISVSDDDDDDDRDTDSEEVSDNEEDEDDEGESVAGEVLQIQEQVENIKSISLSGAEIESLAVEGGDDLDEISDLEDDVQDTSTLDDKTDEIGVEDDIIDDEDNGDEEEEEEEEEIIDDVNVVSTVKKIEVDSNKPLDKMTVKELKAKAEKDGFTNYKGLRKDKLVELLQSQ